MDWGKRILLLVGCLTVSSLGLPASAGAQRSGVEIWAQNCGRCHMPQPANRYTADQWETIVYNMRQLARLTDAETEAVLEFLKGGAKTVARHDPAPGPAIGARRLASLAPLAVPLGPAARTAEEIYAKLCQPCHGATGKGDGPVAAALTPRPSDLTDAQVLGGRTDEEIAQVLKDGKGTMPGFGKQLGAEEVPALVSYLRGLAGAKPTSSRP